MAGYINLFTTKAHVFQINPETKTSWLAKGNSAIPISFVLSQGDLPAAKKELKLVGSTDNGESALDCFISWDTVFNKRSQKFVQWADNTNMVYGLGFNSEADLNEFIDGFINLRHSANAQNGQQPSQQQQQHSDLEESSPVIKTNGSHQVREQLKYENERLKQALEESSKNASLWHDELVNLRTNNLKLTQALQDSGAHVAEWEKELLNLRNENKELKIRVKAIESTSDASNGDKLQEYKNYFTEIQGELQRKEDEVESLQRSVELLELKASNRDDESNTDMQKISNAALKQKIDAINVKLEATTNELVSTQKEFALLADKLQ